MKHFKDYIGMIVVALMYIVAVVAIVIIVNKVNASEQESVKAFDATLTPCTEMTEVPPEQAYEVQKTQAALVDEAMKGNDETLNLDADLVMKVITAEMGDNETFEGVWAVATMMFNSWTTEHSLMDNINNGWYAEPADHIGEKARLAFYEVFIFDNPCPIVEDATYFYSTRNGFVSEGHENRHNLVCIIENYDGSTLRCFR